MARVRFATVATRAMYEIVNKNGRVVTVNAAEVTQIRPETPRKTPESELPPRKVVMKPATISAGTET